MTFTTGEDETTNIFVMDKDVVQASVAKEKATFELNKEGNVTVKAEGDVSTDTQKNVKFKADQKIQGLGASGVELNDFETV